MLRRDDPDSDARPIDLRIASDHRRYLVRMNYGRWSIAAVAACLALPYDTCDRLEEWERLLDRLSVAVDAALGEEMPQAMTYRRR